jgi:hypothetical protein
MEVTLFKTVKKVKTGFNRPVQYALDRIKNGAVEGIIKRIRKGEKELKQQLSGVCFNGTFRNRSAEGLIEHSGLMILDFDKIPKREMKEVRSTLQGCEYIFALWLSPSGNGLKGLVKIPPEAENHKLYYSAFSEFVNSEYLDEGGHDIPRFCFESFDPNIYINKESTEWTDKAVEEFEDIGTNDPVLAITSDNRIIDNLLKWWRSKYDATEGNRNNNLYKLAIAFNDYGVMRNEAERVLSEFEQKDFSHKEIELLIKSAYKKTENFGTKFFEDAETKKKIEKQVRNGKKEADILKMHPNIKKESLEVAIESIKDDMSSTDFWDYANGKIKLSPHKYKFWLQQHNFFKYYPTDSGAFVFIQKDQNLLDETNEKRIKDYVLDYLLKREDLGYKPYDFMANNQKYFTTEYLSILETAKVEIKEDTIDECFIYFKNCVAKVTKDKIEQIDYVDIDGFIWKRQIIDREFKKADHHDAVFRKFLWLISGKDVPRYNSLKSVVGYLLHSYKTSANNKAIIFNDETISENPNGGSGKGLFWNALNQMKRVSSIDGKTFEFTKSFPYQTVSTDTQILVFDDVKKNFGFESLFSLITEGITLEYKGQDAIKLPIQQSPKILITTNYTVGGSGGSFERRKFEVELSSYFNASHTPLDEFKHLLFDEWDSEEWDRFYSFMLNCSQYYLQNGLVETDYKNLHTRKFIKETSHEFFEWTNPESDEKNIVINERIYRNDSYLAFIEEFSDLKKWLTQRRFSAWMDSFGKHYGFDVKKGKSNGVRWIEFVDETKPKPDPSDDLPF